LREILPAVTELIVSRGVGYKAVHGRRLHNLTEFSLVDGPPAHRLAAIVETVVLQTTPLVEEEEPIAHPDSQLGDVVHYPLNVITREESSTQETE
jgi:hypothetical protein